MDSHVGPVDIQVRKGDELFARNSGLEIFEAVTFLQNQTLSAFREQAKALTAQEGLSTRVAADIAARLTRGIFEPIAAQIDPIKLAEMQRANDITMAYGARLSEVGNNVSTAGLVNLVGGYPSHGFVIDRKEARAIFSNVQEPRGKLLSLCESLRETGLHRSVEMNQAQVREMVAQAQRLATERSTRTAEMVQRARENAKGSGNTDAHIRQQRQQSSFVKTAPAAVK